MWRAKAWIVGTIGAAVIGGLASCSSDSEPAPADTATTATPTPTGPATIPTPPSAEAARKAPGAAVLGNDPAASDAGKPVDVVDWFTPTPKNARKFRETPDGCHQRSKSSELTRCILGDKSGKTVVAVAGDSKTRQWVPALDIAAKKLGWRLEVSTKSKCTFTTAPTTDGGIDKPYPSCDEWNKLLIARILKDKPDVFINGLYKMRAKVSGDETAAEARTTMIEGVRDAISQVAKSGTHVIVINSTPINDEKIPDCVAEHAATLTECATPRKRALGVDRTWDAVSSARALSDAPGAQLIDLDDYICPTAVCAPVIGNILVYRDKHHVTVPYMKTLGPEMTRQLEEASANF